MSPIELFWTAKKRHGHNFEFWRFQTIVIGRQSWVKIEEKILRRGDVQKKRHGHNFGVLGSEIESAWDQHGCFNADSISSRNSQNCGCAFFFEHLIIRGALVYQIRSFFEHRSKGGGGHFHVQKFWSKFCMILKAFWQHKIDIKRLFKGRNVSNWG